MPKKILYVEDDTINALIVKKILQKDYHIDIANDSNTALNFLKDQDYEIILLDVNLGEEKIDGIGFMQLIRQSSKNRNTKILAITAFALPDDRDRFLSMGFDEYISKPIDKFNLLETIQKF
jgi:CheY-like chemotaxis protein